MDTTKLTWLFVREGLEKYYAGHGKLQDGIIQEIVDVFNKRRINQSEFISAIRKYREAMSVHGKQNYTPDAWDLLKYTRQARKKIPVKIVMGIPNDDSTATYFYRRNEMVKYCEYGMANYSGIEEGYTTAQWEMLLAKAKIDEVAKEKRTEKTDQEKYDIAKRKAYFTFVLNKIARREVLPVEGLPDLPGPKPSKSLWEQKREL